MTIDQDQSILSCNYLPWFLFQLKYKEVYEKSKAQINMDPEAHEIRAAKEAYKNISNVSTFKKMTMLFGNTKHLSNNHKVLLMFLLLARLQEEVRGN